MGRTPQPKKAKPPLSNHGPPDTRTNPLMMIFPTTDPAPTVWENGEPTSSRNEVYWSHSQIQMAGIVPVELNTTNLIKIWTPPDLKPTNPEIRKWNSHDEFKENLKSQNRTIGIFATTTRGKVDNYRAVITGAKYNVKINTPQALVDLMKSKAVSAIPTIITAHVDPNNIRFRKSRNYTKWRTLEEMGFNGLPSAIPEPVSTRVYCRYKLICQDNNNFQPQLSAEFIILPEDEAHGKLLSNHEEILDRSGALTIKLWTATDSFKWNRTFPTIKGVFNQKLPIPEIQETAEETDIQPSEFNLRRLSFDLHQKSLEGNYTTQLQTMRKWIKDSDRQYGLGDNPTLIIPWIPATPQANLHLQTTWLTTENQSEPNKPNETNETNEAMEVDATEMNDDNQHQQSEPNQILNNNKPAHNRHFTLPRQPDSGSKSKITATAIGKYRKQRNNKALKEKFAKEIPDLDPAGAELLADLTLASITDNTSRNTESIKRCIQRLFPERPNMFTFNEEKDELRIITRMHQAGYKEKTILSYLASYQRIVTNEGGTKFPKPAELSSIIKGLKNIGHNPTLKIALPTRKAYSIQALRLVAVRATTLMKEAGKWTEYQASLFKSVITLLFFGRLRSAEALADNNKHYDLLINLLRSDVVFNKNDEGKITHVTLLLRACKYQEEVGACVVIPAIPGKDFCPVRALREYLKQRKTKTRNFDLPLFITECVWSKGSSKPDWTSPGLLTKAKFKNDTDNAVRELTKHQPNLQEVYAYLYSHSLRSGQSCNDTESAYKGKAIMHKPSRQYPT